MTIHKLCVTYCAQDCHVMFPVGSVVIKVEAVVFSYEWALTGNKELSLPGLTVDH